MSFQGEIATVKLNVRTKEPGVDIFTEEAPLFFSGTNWKLNFGIYDGDDLIDLTGWTTVYLRVYPENKIGDTAVLTEKNTSSFNASLVEADFKAGTNQHFTIEYPFADTVLSAQFTTGVLEKTFTAVVSATITGSPGRRFVLGTFPLRVKLSGLT